VYHNEDVLLIGDGKQKLAESGINQNIEKVKYAGIALCRTGT